MKSSFFIYLSHHKSLLKQNMLITKYKNELQENQILVITKF